MSEQLNPLTLLPCPFCGSTDLKPVLDTEYNGNGSGRWAAVFCCITGPEIRANYGRNKEWEKDAVIAWNTRTIATSKAEKSQDAALEIGKIVLRELDTSGGDYLTVRKSVSELSGIPPMAKTFNGHIDAIRAALQSKGPPEGYVLMPLEPTNEMADAFLELFTRCKEQFTAPTARQVWKAMTSAAKKEQK